MAMATKLFDSDAKFSLDDRNLSRIRFGKWGNDQIGCFESWVDDGDGGGYYELQLTTGGASSIRYPGGGAEPEQVWRLAK